ncbi:MAG: hypothetical protein QOI80_542 [Solirubrobacteraceae bacterium]|jgi:hypothetical protein|nr:hypothetical protein [Solirubrobacteraceae bacterium]
MRFRILCLCLLAAVVAPTAASAKLTVGISDNRPAMLADPLFTQLGAKQVRIVVSYDAMGAAARGDNEISDRVAPYITAASSQGVEILVAFEHSRGEPLDCRTSHKPQCKLPTASKYKSEIAKFVKAFPQVKYITAWNESNHPSQPTVDDPRRAGQFARAADSVCRSAGTCKALAIDVLDQANDPKVPTRRLSYSRTITFIKALKRGYGKSRPSICGIHNYADVNRFRTAGTKALTRAMKCKSVWLTETGGFYKFASFWSRETKKNAVGRCVSSATCQVAALKYLFNHTVKAAGHIDRAYIYNFYSGNDGRFDAGITKGDGFTPNGKKRPGFDVVAAHI